MTWAPGRASHQQLRNENRSCPAPGVPPLYSRAGRAYDTGRSSSVPRRTCIAIPF